MNVVAFVNAADGDAHGLELVKEGLENNRLYLVHAIAQGLGHEDIVVAVHRKARHFIGIAKDEAAAGKVLFAHNRAAVVQSILDAALPKGFVEAVVGIGRKDAHADFGNEVGKARTEVFPLVTEDIDDVPRFKGAVHAGHFFSVNPGMAAAGCFFPFFCDV